MENLMELGQVLTLTEESMWGIGRIIEDMVKEHSFHLMEKSMMGNGKMIKNTVKEQKLILMVQSM